MLLVDFSNFFGNIDHAATKRLIDRALDDERIKALMYAQVDSHGTRGPWAWQRAEPDTSRCPSKPVDHMLLRTPCVLASGRYMDDLYCIALDKADLRGVLADIRRECAKLGIVVNEKKTRIVKLTRGFTFLKKRFNYGETGKVIGAPVPFRRNAGAAQAEKACGVRGARRDDARSGVAKLSILARFDDAP